MSNIADLHSVVDGDPVNGSRSPKTPAPAPRVLSDSERLGLGAIWYQSAPPGDWIKDAECRHHPDLAPAFTDAVHNDNSALARTVCSNCPVRFPCLSYRRQLQATGIWGGEMLYRGQSRGRNARQQVLDR